MFFFVEGIQTKMNQVARCQRDLTRILMEHFLAIKELMHSKQQFSPLRLRNSDLLLKLAALCVFTYKWIVETSVWLC